MSDLPKDYRYPSSGVSGPTTPTKKVASRSNIPSPKANLTPPRYYKKRVASTPPRREELLASISSINNNKENVDFHRQQRSSSSHQTAELSSFYKEYSLQLKSLQSDVNNHQSVRDNLSNKNSLLENEILSLKFKLDSLSSNNSVFVEKVKSKENQLKELNEIKILKEKNIVDNHHLEINQLKSTHDNELSSIIRQYKKKYESTKFSKLESFGNQKKDINEKLSVISKDIINNEKNLNSELRKVDNNQSKSNIDWLKENQTQYNEKTKENNGLTKEIYKLSENIKKQLEPDCSNKRKELQLQIENNNNLDSELSDVLKEKENLIEHISSIQKKLLDLKNENETQLKLIEDENEKRKILSKLIIENDTNRRIIHNQFQELRGNIRVYCRVRPPLKKITNSPQTSHFSIEIPEDKNILEVQNFDQTKGTQTIKVKKLDSNNNATYSFEFDHVFKQDEGNSEVFNEIEQLIQSALDGYNVCIFAYGQTGSGKTYTMLNPNDGVIPMTIKYIFNSMDSLKKNGWEYNVSCEFIELYNENIIDLFRDNGPTKDSISHEIRHDDQSKITYVTNIKRFKIENISDTIGLINKSKIKRMTSSTGLNSHSSRSHGIFIIYLEGYNHKTNEKCISKLNLVDLAGSERINFSKVQGDRLKETQSINKSLSCLGDVIHALNRGNKNHLNSNDLQKTRHIPFRNSKLTYLLKYSLIGDSKTLMFVNVSSNEAHLNETINSLRFATKVNNTKAE
ncbi:hypothetical protein TBLA_0C03940 [Henningerozyma blattae CBS 6284]|uniref:Kinesin-like protein n=1 Tax=Henningerozyma blattae (strain ATCC 34711 / CBS 6284 / DSM 70876 / NBRC 10599 / NRRL Y-10934 / UCD 77-7) TaxID=1071380 RepID=I2H1E3_HENB6|nr:hypothetical protein TBLA_0C03940 [Tetrapisispora blattae CBS 6284]CCH60195.1 hypothetical protein TBLA_0C03940 [Tetrapisispora blattae CBS 6284]